MLKSLYRIECDGTYCNTELNALLSRVPAADRALATELLYGVVKMQLALDHIIMQFSKIRIKKMTPWVHLILRMGIYQMYYMDKIPPSAACNESVKLAKKYAHINAANFVNGVLRGAARGLENIRFPDRKNLTEYLSVSYSYPKWLVEKLLPQYGEQVCETILREGNTPSSPTVRVNRLKTGREELRLLLHQEGIETVPDSAMEDCLHVTGKIDIARSACYKNGLYSLQGINSMRAAAALDPRPGETVIDLCAAPGGKSTYLAERMENRGRVFAYDLHPHKIALIQNYAQRLGITIIQAAVHDSTELLENHIEQADRVLADVPCSGLGVIRSKPDIKWRHTPADVEALTEIQADILNCAARYVKPGGILVYSTCTVLKEENEMQAATFLRRHPEFEKLGEKQFLPGEEGGSGFYICKMKKRRV